ncbi:MAG: GntR family transcriptional regulator [Candidatus Hinthialibacter antarcticus]|nr:GntR family transcriptional regulator [Candidatus Hinthialibacter antarcticus]
MGSLFERLPKYIQIKEAIRQDIEQGTLKEGDQLPSETHLIDRFGASKMTVIRALQELVQEGFLRRVQGKGTYVLKPEQQGPVLGVLLSSRPWNEPWLLLKSIEDRASQLGLETCVCISSNDFLKVDRFADRLIQRRVAGVIVSMAEPDFNGLNVKRWVSRLLKAQTPVVILDGCKACSSEAYSIHFNHESGMASLTKSLVESGHNRLLLVDDESCCESIRTARRSGFETITRELSSVEWSDVCVWKKRQSMLDFVQHLSRKIKQERPGMVMCIHDGLVSQLKTAFDSFDAELDFPIAMSGFGGGGICAALDLTTVDLPWNQMGLLAVDAVQQSVYEPERDVVLEGRVQLRSSLATLKSDSYAVSSS